MPTVEPTAQTIAAARMIQGLPTYHRAVSVVTAVISTPAGLGRIGASGMSATSLELRVGTPAPSLSDVQLALIMSTATAFAWAVSAHQPPPVIISTALAFYVALRQSFGG